MAFEQNKPIEIQDVETELGKKVNTSDVLSLEGIQSGTDLTGKVASASALKSVNNGKLDTVSIKGATSISKGHWVSVGNIGGTKKTITITLSNSEQFVFLFGATTNASCIMSYLGGGNITDYSFGKTSLICDSKTDIVLTVTLGPWFRGFILSYLPFVVKGI